MSVETLKVSGITFDVYYECEIEQDPLGTGDSPTSYSIEITDIEIGTDTQNVLDILPNSIIEDMIDQLIQIEANGE